MGFKKMSVAILVAGISMSAVAKEKPEWRSWPLGSRMVGALSYYMPRLQTEAAVSDSNGNLGALISFEDTLGLSDNEATPLAFVGWRISKRNYLEVNYFKLDRSATQDSTIDIAVTNDSPPPDYLTESITLPLSAVFNIQAIDVTYAFSPIFTAKHNLGLGIGLALQKLEFGYQASENCNVEPACSQFGAPRQAKSVAPLPTFKLIYQYAINDKWLIDTNIGYFALDLELDSKENIGGQIWNASAAIHWKTWKHVGFNLSYKYFDVDLDYEKRDLQAAANYDYRGFAVGMNAYF
jgi:hypothetical protein